MCSFGIIYVDAYDSFANNITALLAQLAPVTVIKIDEEVADLEVLLSTCAAVVIGPGPGHPENSQDIGLIPSIFTAAIKHEVPVLGICLGFQVLCSMNGLPITRLPLPCHGHAKEILHIGGDIFQNAKVVLATCYNSLGVHVNELNTDAALSRPGSSGSSDCSSIDTSSPSLSPNNGSPIDLIALAQDSEGYLMAVKHRTLPQWGLQFHPESCKSNLACHEILKNWWEAVSSWNRYWRKDSGDMCLLPTNMFSSNISRTKSTDDIFGYLLRLAETGGPILHSKTISSESSAEAISAICYTESHQNNVAMLESTKKGRYSIYAMPSPSSFNLEHRAGVLRVQLHDADGAQWTVSARESLDLVEQLVLHKKVSQGPEARGFGSWPFWGGFLGYLSYELGLDLLNVDHSDSSSTPGLALLWVERSIIVDHVDHTTTVQSHRRDDNAWIENRIKQIADQGRKVSLNSEHRIRFQEALRRSSYVPPKEVEYKSRIATCLEHLRAGNSYELCLTTEAQIRMPASIHHPYQLYQNLRRCNPVPFAAYIALGNTIIVSSSPEQFLTWDREGTVDMIPMKGTVRKSPSMTFARASVILASPKEQAENLMIADLIRHDLHSALGPNAHVSVEKLCVVEEHETVYQLVSHIRAKAPPPPPSPPASSAEYQEPVICSSGHRVLRHALPPGSMTGAPKKRSCEILSQLENRDRGAYSGVIGFFDVGGGGSWSVCIRSAFMNTTHTHTQEQDQDTDEMQTWRIGAGGAITVLSDPQAEWEEMQTKLQSVLRAFEPDSDT